MRGRLNSNRRNSESYLVTDPNGATGLRYVLSGFICGFLVAGTMAASRSFDAGKHSKADRVLVTVTVTLRIAMLSGMLRVDPSTTKGHGLGILTPFDARSL